MTYFQNGPAVGEGLYMKRAPIFLRVAHSEAEGFRALDQRDDGAEPWERLWAYRLVGEAGVSHARQSRKKKGGMVVTATYRMVEVQPTDAEMRSTYGWQKWCEAEADRQGIDGEREVSE